MKLIILIKLIILLGISGLNAQTLKGKVIENGDTENTIGIPYVNVLWHGTTVGITTDEYGYFEIEKTSKNNPNLIITCMGYISDTIAIKDDQSEITIILQPTTHYLDEVTVQGKRDPLSINTADIKNSQHISSDGIQQLACCSLADCFENNAAVDVGFADAVTGAKQIQMLGLAGKYSQILVENQPFIRILSSMYGINYVPGPWLRGISISKGTASVSQGPESITGQINIEIKRPDGGEKFYLEYFTNDYLKQELNLNTAFRINDKLQSIVLLKGAWVKKKVDRNNDTFLDVPLSDLILASNRFFYKGKKIRSRFGYDFIYEDRIGGQLNFDKVKDKGTTNNYGVIINTKRIQIFEKTGFIINPEKNSSIGLRGNFVYHEQHSQFGLRKYDPTQKSGYFTALFISDIIDNNNKISTGVNFYYDNLKETFTDTVLFKEEIVTGAYAEYTFNDKQKWSVIAGLRGDYNNNHGFFLVPRFHCKYTPFENSAFRVSGGRGLRSSNVISEHISLLASSRELVVSEQLDLEDAWNYGISYTQNFFFEDDRKITFNIDFYRTDFQNRVIVDLEQGTDKAFFYNLKGKSFSNSFQIDLIVNPFKAFDITFAYRINDAKTTINNKLLSNPLVAKHKALMALHYSTRYERWNFSFTTQYIGESRLPVTKNNPIKYRLPENSNDYLILHAQITRKLKNMEFFIGVENLTNYKQKNPILGFDDPFGDYFDSSIVYAPILGRQFNFGFRLIIL